MAVKVVDVSALAAVSFGEPEAEHVAERIEGHRLVAPALLPFELASVCLKKLRAYPNQRGAILAAHALSRSVAIDEVSVDTENVVLLAEQTGLTVYDAAYLWLARTLGAELVTLDAQLARAAR